MNARDMLQWLEQAPAPARASAAHTLVKGWLSGEGDAETRSGIEATMTLLLDDVSPDVRLALAESLCDSPKAPRHIVLSLAGDQPAIAAIVLARSPLFIDAELVDIVAAASEELQVAVASRPRLSSAVSAAIAEVGEADACRQLLGNSRADLARVSLRRIAERFGDDPAMRDHLLCRVSLSPDIRLMLIGRLGDALGEFVVDRAWMPEGQARLVTREACERATIALAAESETDELPALVEHLRISGQLTTGLLLRAVCAGNVGLFETVLAMMARVPFWRVAKLVRGGRRNALRAIYARAGLPMMAFAAFAAALGTARRLDEQGRVTDRYRYTRQMVDSVLAHYRNITDSEANELTAMLRRFAAEQAREAARDFARESVAAA